MIVAFIKSSPPIILKQFLIESVFEVNVISVPKFVLSIRIGVLLPKRS